MGTIPSPLRLALAAMLCVVGLTKQAGATVTIALEWGECGGGTGGCSATGTDTIAVDITGGQTLRLDIFLSHDLPQGLLGHSFSLRFDADLENELNLGPMAPVEWAGTDTTPDAFAYPDYRPFNSGLGPPPSVESTLGSPGRVNSFESLSFDFLDGVLPANGVAYTVGTFSATAPARYRVGQAFFTTNFAPADGADVFSGLFNVSYDLFLDGDGNPVSVGTIIFGTATVNPLPGIPEPGTASLLGLGLVGLALASRRSRA